MIRDVLQETELRMMTAVEAIESDLATFRTGRASPGLVERVVVQAYGAEVNLRQVALISVPEPQQLVVSGCGSGGGGSHGGSSGSAGSG